MKIIVIHGDDIPKSDLRLQKFTSVAKERGWEIIRATDKSYLSIPEELSSSSLFNKERLFIIDNPTLIGKADLVWLKKKSENFPGTLLIYHSDYLSKTFLSSLPGDIKIEQFSLPRIIFTFLDSFYPENSPRCLTLMHEVIKHEPGEFVFALLAKQLRDLYWVRNDGKTLKYPAWRVAKLKNQSAKFTPEQLRDFMSKLADIDLDTKTSRAELIPSLDLLIASQLQ